MCTYGQNLQNFLKTRRSSRSLIFVVKKSRTTIFLLTAKEYRDRGEENNASWWCMEYRHTLTNDISLYQNGFIFCCNLDDVSHFTPSLVLLYIIFFLYSFARLIHYLHPSGVWFGVKRGTANNNSWSL